MFHLRQRRSPNRMTALTPRWLGLLCSAFCSACFAQAPVNDHFTNAIVLEGNSAIFSGSLTNATFEPGESTVSCGGHDFGGGWAAAARAGGAHGVWCLGCCWALMAVLAVLGLMNIAWMALIAAIFFIEKNVRRGELLPRIVGVACIAGGLAVLVWPALL